MQLVIRYVYFKLYFIYLTSVCFLMLKRLKTFFGFSSASPSPHEAPSTNVFHHHIGLDIPSDKELWPNSHSHGDIISESRFQIQNSRRLSVSEHYSSSP